MALWKLPAVVLAFLAWWSAPPASLADASRHEAVRREFSGRATRGYTNQDLPPAPEIPVVAAEPPASEDTTPPGETKPGEVKPGEAKPEEDKAADEKHDEKWWHDRMSGASADLERDRGLAAAMQSHINALTTDWINRDNPVQKAQLFEERQRAFAELDRLKKAVTADQAAIDAVREDARRQGVPPGWIR